MNTPDHNGQTPYQSLIALRDKAGLSPEALKEYEEKDAPQEFVELWYCFLELSATRQFAGESPCPISYRDIESWGNVCGEKVSPFSVDVVMSVDRQWIKNYNEDQKKKIKAAAKKNKK